MDSRSYINQGPKHRRIWYASTRLFDVVRFEASKQGMTVSKYVRECILKTIVGGEGNGE